MIKIFDRLFFMGPMSLGDSFVLCGMVNHYADRCKELHVPADPRFFKTIKTLYQDHPNIRVVAMPQDWHSEDLYVERHQLSRILRIDLVHSAAGRSLGDRKIFPKKCNPPLRHIQS